VHPELIPGWPIHSYGLMLVVGFYGAYFLARRTAKKEGIDPNRLTDMLILAVVLGIVGSRAFYLVQYRERIRGVLDLIAIWRGGLVFYRGLVAATVGLMVYVRVKHIPLWRVGDAIAPAIMLGLALGRIGCFLNGCCWGHVVDESFPLAVRFPRFVSSTAHAGCRERAPEPGAAARDGQWHPVFRNAPTWVRSRENLMRYVDERPDAYRKLSMQWARSDAAPDGSPRPETITGSYAFLQHLVQYPRRVGPDDARSLPVHPTQLYSSASALAICGLLLLWRRWRRRPGEVLALLACLYAPARFWLESLRNDTNPVLGCLTVSQVVSIGVFAVGVSAFVWCRLRGGELDRRGAGT